MYVHSYPKKLEDTKVRGAFLEYALSTLSILIGQLDPIISILKILIERSQRV